MIINRLKKDTMNIRQIILTIAFLMVCIACENRRSDVQITILPEVVSTGFIGNGAEWDPYDEAEAWGSTISDEDWNKLFSRLDYMKPQYIRCMINSPYRYYNVETGKYDKNRNIESISRLLKYCTEHDITVIYGEYNPPTWDMKQDQEWIDMSVDYLNYLVTDLGFSCINHFVIFNEPDGNWASTNGDYELWKNVLFRFHEKMKTYPGLLEKVSFAGPDVVVNYKNPVSPYDAEGWVKQAVSDVDSLIGIYDIHAYPGQGQVRAGEYKEILAKYKRHIPKGKKILLGEAGYKYWNPADSILGAEYRHRVENHPFTKGSDCNMFVYDYFYGLDMPLLAMEVMNSGYAGVAAWMLDDAMHSKNDSGKTEDIKIWGMWNILGEEVFSKSDEENIRPWYYTWALMCRYFPAGSEILKTSLSDIAQGIYAVAGRYKGLFTIALVNVGNEDKEVVLNIPKDLNGVQLFKYEEQNMPANQYGFPIPVEQKLDLSKYFSIKIKAQSFVLLTQLQE